MKRLILLLLLTILVVQQSISQTYYETSWRAEGVKYTGLLIYYDDNDAVMRVGYTLNGEYNVSEYQCYGHHFEEDGYTGYLLDGKEAKGIHGSTSSYYSPDNFIFIDHGEGYSQPTVIDDQSLEQHLVEDHFMTVDYWSEISTDKFTESYVNSFFYKSEPLYEVLVSYNQKDQYREDDPNIDQSSNLHLILVTNTSIPDIGQSCNVDKDKALSEIEVICHELNMPVIKTVISDKKFNKQSVTDAINNLNPNSNDVVIFIYSGHGYRWSNQESHYPNLDLRFSNYQALSKNTSYNLATIYNSIIEKGARLNIVIGDCCNSDVGVSMRSGESSLVHRSHAQGKIDKLKTLFLKSRGNLIAAAAKPYETACGSSRDGGYFISSFFTSITKETSVINTNTPSWNNIVSRTINTARYKTENLQGCTPQNGIYYSTIK